MFKGVLDQTKSVFDKCLHMCLIRPKVCQVHDKCLHVCLIRPKVCAWKVFKCVLEQTKCVHEHVETLIHHRVIYMLKCVFDRSVYNTELSGEVCP